jgi:hypothetical protein
MVISEKNSLQFGDLAQFSTKILCMDHIGSFAPKKIITGHIYSQEQNFHQFSDCQRD